MLYCHINTKTKGYAMTYREEKYSVLVNNPSDFFRGLAEESFIASRAREGDWADEVGMNHFRSEGLAYEMAARLLKGYKLTDCKS